MKKKETYYGALNIVHKNGYPKVEKVYDGEEVIIIEVLPEDERKGIPFDRNKCAMARATCRNTHSTGAIIGATSSFIIKGNTAYRYKNAETLTREVVSYDRAKIFLPGKYRLSPFPPSNRLGAHRSGPSGKKRKGGNNRIETFRHITKNVRTLK